MPWTASLLVSPLSMEFSKRWVAIPFSRGSSRPRDTTWVSHIAGRLFTRCLSHQSVYISIYLYVCICIYVCKYMYVYVCICVCVCMYTYVYVYVCVCIYVCMCVYFYICIYICKYIYIFKFISSVQSLGRVQLLATHEPQHTRLPCPSPTPRACSNSCPSSQ